MSTADSKSEAPASPEPAPIYPLFCYRQRQRVLATQLDTTLEIGRQREEEPAPVVRIDSALGARVILAPIDDVAISRSHVEVGPTDSALVQIRNLSATQLVRISPNQTLEPGAATRMTPPVLLQFGDYAVRVDPPEDEQLQLEGLPERTIPPGRIAPPASAAMLGATFDEGRLLRWLETILGVFQSAANAHDFSEQAARAAVKIVGLDAAAVLRCEEGRWKTEALYAADQRPGENQSAWAPSQTLLGWVRRDRRTFRHVPPTGPDTPRSLQNVSALVAAPILNGAGEVIGALYGDRRSGERTGGMPIITEFEAKLVELLASGIAAGLARLKEEQAAVAARVQFEQFFTPQLATQLQRDPGLLEGRNAEVTILFADIRGFSRIAEQLGPDRTMAWIQDTMGALSESVLAYDGVLVDYIGDELMAMWGAPAPQTDHARLACLAAQHMLEQLDAISARWQAELGAPVRLGIGLNSGVARVGNTGSALKFKYGPLGDVVNVASRVQGATKYLGADCLITGETLKRLPAEIANRRLARVRAVNIAHPIDLYELVPNAGRDWEQNRTAYDAALRALEQENWPQATAAADALAKAYPEDAAIAALVKRVASADRTDLPGDTSVWQLPGK
ncbi:adenylate/guanylate cyclase domain-containing protein [Lacipirellula parvula]|uniref:Adenylate cyclase n=1 Tax=Lacipirellula parvula TaxID=2650471 RepID=A0A5K7XL51_9BACT|nr:adenylate/guanylate cyclase domain-containing protein [Lacipirellula parvula]BBO33679.1 adenylate cyclase [Lacipirellula parvula]